MTSLYPPILYSLQFSKTILKIQLIVSCNSVSLSIETKRKHSSNLPKFWTEFSSPIKTQRNHYSNLPKFWTEFLSRNLFQLNKFEIVFPGGYEIVGSISDGMLQIVDV